MFWQLFENGSGPFGRNRHSGPSELDTILERKEVSIKDVLEAEHLLQELRCNHVELVRL
jgi:hypothetical protein